MSASTRFVICVQFLATIFGCTVPDERTTSSAAVDSHYASLDGLWIADSTTAWHFASGTMESVLRLTTSPDGQIVGSGSLIWNGDYSESWPITYTFFDRAERRLSVVDGDGDTLSFAVDPRFQILRGQVIPADATPGETGDSLRFVRAPSQLGERLFDVRKPDANGGYTWEYASPAARPDGIKTASLADAGDHEGQVALARVVIDIISQRYGRIEALLISSKGELVVEEYFYGHDEETSHKIFSCTKSVASLVLGQVLELHPEVTLDQSVFDFFPSYDTLRNTKNEQITLRDVLTMQSGWQWDEIPRELYEAKDWMGYVLGLPVEYDRGTSFEYNSGGSILLCGIVEELEHRHMDELAAEWLFEPLGISEVFWQKHRDGTPNCAWGIEMRPRDMLKIGQLVLNDGVWEGKQVVPADWLQESTTRHARESDYFNYGYQWWMRSGELPQWWNENLSVGTEEPKMIVALGFAGQYIIVVEELDLVVVLTASNAFDGGQAIGEVAMVIDRILPLFSRDRD